MIYDNRHQNTYALLRRPHRILISGSRGYTDFDQFNETLNSVIKKLAVNISEIVFISGDAKGGADAFIEKVCKGDPDKHVIVYPANWDEDGKSAGFIRNYKMVKISSHLVAWWDGNSPGTKHAIEQAREKSLRINVFLINKNTKS
jgi:hypothetical protein